MAERGSSTASSGAARGASTRTDLPLAEVDAVQAGLAATALDQEPAADARRSGGATPGHGTSPGRSTPGRDANDGAATEVDPWIGRILANVYKVDAKIGEGGMGAVYRATHIHLGKQVAVKVLTDAIAQKRDAVERLRQEAIAASSIDHDNIVDVVSFDRYEDGSVFILMELLRGDSLAERIESLRQNDKVLSVQQTVQIALQICDALGAAHERNIVHRDLKPENVFLAKKGERERVKVLDFGISKIKSADAEQVRMTRTGQLVGTPLYMSPEQARGETDIDKRVDVYALGVMLFEMLTSAPPFDGRNYFELLWKHGNEAPPSVRERRPELGVPVELDEAVQKALAKDRGARFQTMGELADALRAAVPDTSLPAQSIPPELRTSRTSGPGAGSSPSNPMVAALAGQAAPTPISASTSAPPLPVSSPSSMLLWGGAAGILGVVVLGIWMAVAGIDPPASTTPEPRDLPGTVATGPTIEPPPTHDPVPPTTAVEPPRVEGALPAATTVSLGSEPMGAAVYQGETLLCTTPCLHDLPTGAETELSFRREGYHDTIERLTPVDGLALSPRLRARRRTPTDGTGVGGGPAIKTTL